MIVWNGADIVLAVILVGAIAFAAVILALGWFCRKLEDWGKKRQEKEEQE